VFRRVDLLIVLNTLVPYRRIVNSQSNMNNCITARQTVYIDVKTTSTGSVIR